MFVVLVVHALVVVTLTTLRADTGQLKDADVRDQASLEAHSAALFALDQLSGAAGPDWENNHTSPKRAGNADPPANADHLTMASRGDSDLKVLAWVEETGDPTLRTVWGACNDGKQWHYSTAVAVRRYRNPGVLFGIKKGSLIDDFYFRPLDGTHDWEHAPVHPSINNNIYDCSAGRDGKLYVLQSDRTDPNSGLNLRVTMLDSQAAIRGQWYDLTPLPSGFAADPTGLAAGQNDLYVSGLNTSDGKPAIMKLPLSPTGTAWSPMATLPGAVTVDSHGSKTLTTYPFQFTDLKAGPQGELYLQLQLQTGSTSSDVDTTFARYQNGNWEYFPKPDGLDGVSRRSFLPIEVDDVGNLLTFGLPKDNQPGQIYRFASTGVVQNGVIQGLWKAMPTDPSLSDTDKLRQLTVDTQGHMVTALGDTVAGTRPVQQLKQVPLRADQTSQMSDMTLPVTEMNRVEAGGLGPSGNLEYVPVSWY